MKTGLNATKLAIAAFIVPYMFCLNPSLLLMDGGVLNSVQLVVTSLIGLFGVSVSLEGFLGSRLPVVMRILAALGGLMLIYAGTVTDITGIVLVAFVVFFGLRRKSSLKENGTESE